MVHRKKKLCKIIKNPLQLRIEMMNRKTHRTFQSLQQWSTHDVPLNSRSLCGLACIYFSFSSDQLRSKQIDRYMHRHRHRHLVHFEMNDLLFLIFLRLFLRLTAAYTCQPGIIGFYTGGTIFCICRIYNYIFSTCLTIWSTIAHVSSSYTLTGPEKCRAN